MMRRPKKPRGRNKYIRKYRLKPGITILSGSVIDDDVSVFIYPTYSHLLPVLRVINGEEYKTPAEEKEDENEEVPINGIERERDSFGHAIASSAS